jgi:integrase
MSVTEDVTTFGKSRYRRILVSFMSFLDKVRYPSAQVFSVERMLEVDDTDVYRFFCMKAYGKEQPQEGDKAVCCRSTTLQFYKKALSQYMPRRNFQWDDVSKQGNPTKSQLVNQVIKRVMLGEVRKEGAPTKKVRPLEYEEFLNIVEVLRDPSNGLFRLDERVRLLSIITLQWQAIGRIDDMMKMRFNNIKYSVATKFTAMFKMEWSKNITEERQSPLQILLPAMDERVCSLYYLALYLEVNSDRFISKTGASFLYGNRKDGHQVVRNGLQKILDSPLFNKIIEGNIGTHSFRKGASTYCSRNGYDRDWITFRGRWRGHKHQVDTYIDINRPYPDAMISSCLCGAGGPAVYMLRHDNTWLTVQSVCEDIFPHISRLMSRELALILGLPLIYAATHSTGENAGKYFMPEAVRTKIMQRLGAASGGKEDSELATVVTKRGLLVSGYHGQVSFTELEDDSTNRDTENITTGDSAVTGARNAISASSGVVSVGGSSSTALQARQLNAIQGSILQLKRRVEELNDQLNVSLMKSFEQVGKKQDRININVSRIAVQPIVRRVETSTEISNPGSRGRSIGTTLSKKPIDLYELWREYQFGIGNRKAARFFTRVERGAQRSLYSFRKVFWDAVELLIRKGMTSDTAVDNVYQVYGRNKTVTQILRCMHEDRRNKVDRL